MKKRDEAKPTISNREWKARARDAAEKCKTLQRAARQRALSPDLTVEEQRDAWSESDAYGVMAENWQRTAAGRDDWRDIQEAKGSAKGIEKRQSGAAFTYADFLDEVRAIYRPNESAEWHRQRLVTKGVDGGRGKKSVERALKKIRGT